MNPRRIMVMIGLLLTASTLTQAAELAGKWTSEFDSQIGKQKYTFEFKVVDGALTGKAAHDHSMGQGEAVLKAIKVDGDTVSFEEPLDFDGNEITIRYTGTISGDEMKLTRNVGEWGSEQIVAKRVKP